VDISLSDLYDPKSKTVKSVHEIAGVENLHPSARYRTIRWQDMEGSGLGFRQEDVMLYITTDFREQVECILEDVIDKGHMGAILGPPGQGKSITGYYASLLACKEGWKVLLIRVLPDGNHIVVCMDNKMRLVHSMPGQCLDSLLPCIFRADQPHDKLLIVLDFEGIVEDAEFIEWDENIGEWRMGDDREDLMNCRRYFYIRNTIDPIRPERDNYTQNFFVVYKRPTWQSADLVDALDNVDFANHVASYCLKDDLDEKLRVSGIRPGFVFYNTLSEVKAIYTRLIDELLTEKCCVGKKSPLHFLREYGRNVELVLVSRWVEDELRHASGEMASFLREKILKRVFRKRSLASCC